MAQVAVDTQATPAFLERVAGYDYNDQMCDGEMGRTEGRSGVCPVETGRTGDMTGHNSTEDQADANGLHCHRRPW